MIYKLGELFAGPGGLGWGANQARVSRGSSAWRIEHAWANDLDPAACDTYRANVMPRRPRRVITGPVQTLDFTKLPRVDAVTFGFPCNDYSIVGEHRGLEGEYGPLYTYGVKAVKEFSPAWFLAENVTGIQSANDGCAFSQILEELAAVQPGYRLTAHEYRFEDYGVPQRRHRIIIVGIRADLGPVFRVPAPTTAGRPVTAAEALAGVETVPYNNELTRHADRVVEMLSYIAPGDNAWSDSVPERLRLNVKGARLSQIYRRLKPDEPAYTVTGSGGGGTHVYHWDEPRALTNRERARLQTFPDDFVFSGSKEQVRKQIGMAVPPRAAQTILEAVLKTLAGIEYPSVDASISVPDASYGFVPVQLFS